MKLLFIAACFASVAVAHTTNVCTLTSESNPGVFVVAIGTYHPASEKLNHDAKAVLGPSDSAGVANDFGTACSLGGHMKAGATLAETETELKTKCSGSTYTSKLDGSTKKYIHADSVLTCYDADPGKTSTSQVQYLSASTKPPACSFSNYYYHQPKSFYFVPVEGETSGTFSFQWLRPNQVLEGGGQRPPCSTIRTKKNFLSITVADGKGKCTTSPPVPTGIDPASIQNCLRSSGAVCNGQCLNSAEQRLGQLVCEDGNWTNTQMCSSKPLCLKPTTLSGISHGPAGVTGAGCGTLTEAGTKCGIACDLGYRPSAGGKILCNAGAKGAYGTWSLENNPQCELVPCPAGSTGTSVLSGCRCLAGYQGSITISGKFPYYTGGCKLPTKQPTATKKPTTKKPTTKKPTTKTPTTKKPTTKKPTHKPVNCFTNTKESCNHQWCEWAEHTQTHGCVPKCWMVMAEDRCAALKGCDWVADEHWCEEKDHEKHINDHKPTGGGDDGAKDYLDYCGKDASTFCPSGTVSAKDCNVEGGNREAVCCQNPTGLLSCYVKECVYSKSTEKCKLLDLHPSTCTVPQSQYTNAATKAPTAAPMSGR